MKLSELSPDIVVELQAGKEADELIAEAFFGNPLPSSEFSQTWEGLGQLFEKLAELGYDPILIRDCVGECYVVDVFGNDGQHTGNGLETTSEAVALTPQMALVRASLLFWLEINKKGE